MNKRGGRIEMTEEEKQTALEALERNGEIFESSQKEQSICHAEFHTNQATIRAALTAQEQIDALYGIIESQKQTHDALIKMNKELLEALKEVRDAIRTEGVLNNMKYDELGVKVYQAIARAESSR